MTSSVYATCQRCRLKVLFRVYWGRLKVCEPCKRELQELARRERNR